MMRLLLCLLVIAASARVAVDATRPAPPQAAASSDTERLRIREELLAELRPVTLRNCTLKRFGGANDGGYLMCENLMSPPVAAYSYGINTEDNWGCQVANQYRVTVHQYDCFTPHRPECSGGRVVFHDECIGPKAETINGDLFDTLTNQIAKSGHRAEPVLVKMDIEGAEWDSLLATPDSVLARLDQLPMELHGVNEQKFVTLVRKLKRTFHLANLHFNNYACSAESHPLPAPAYQVLWVNKRLGQVDPAASVPAPMSPLNAPDAPELPDCQLPPGR